MKSSRRRYVKPALAFLLLLVSGIWLPTASLDRESKEAIRPSPREDRASRTERARRLAGRSYAVDRVLVKFRPEVPAEVAEGLLQGYALRKVRRLAGIGVYCVQTPGGVDVPRTLSILRRNPNVAYANPDWRTRLAVTPNDTFFMRYQYNLYNRGIVLNISQDINPQTTAKADIKATAAWEQTEGAANVVIAIVDTGVDMTHLDLTNKCVSTGRDFVNNDMDASDDNWHGTFVAGVAAANTNNNEGIAGVAWNCKILPVKVMDKDGNGYYSTLIDGLIWAADNGANVINLSLGGDIDDPSLKAACKYAYDKNVVIAAAAGNDGGPVLYPAAYDDYVLAVASTDYNDAVSSFSNFGPQVDVAAPGAYILGPVPQAYAGPDSLPYVFGSGTSAAAPHVSGLAALLLSDKPWLVPKDVMNIIRYTADDVNKSTLPGKDVHIGYGRINMEKALVPYELK